MCKMNKNLLVEYYFNENDKKSYTEVSKHIVNCEACSKYIAEIKQTQNALNLLEDSEPLPQTFDLILDKIYEVPQLKPAQHKSKGVNPIFFLSAVILLILALLYIFQIKIQNTGLWESLKTSWIVETFGSYGLTALIFFCLGSFITLSIAPIMYINSKQGSKIILK